MKLSPLLLASLLVAAPVLAGCLGADEAGPAGEPAENNGTRPNVTTVTPDGRSGEMVAYEETNRTEEGAGGMAHDHDYWNGKQRVTIMESTEYMVPWPRAGGETGTYSEFRIPRPGLVYEGTGKVEFTVSNPRRHGCMPGITWPYEYLCTSNWHQEPFSYPAPSTAAPDPRPPNDLVLLYKHASTDEWVEAGILQWDTPLAIEVEDPTWTDMPHAVGSLWVFRVVSSNPEDATLLFDVSVTVVKAGEVQKWPPHPDFYAETPWRKVFEGSAVTVDKRELPANPVQEETQPVVPEKLVSWGTRTLHVWVNITNVEGLANPTSWFVEWRNATGGWQYTDPFAEGYGSGETSYYFKLPVQDSGMDSPYSTGSRWLFLFQGAYQNCVGGCGDYKVEYDMSIVSTNVPLPEEEYTPRG